MTPDDPTQLTLQEKIDIRRPQIHKEYKATLAISKTQEVLDDEELVEFYRSVLADIRFDLIILLSDAESYFGQEEDFDPLEGRDN